MKLTKLALTCALTGALVACGSSSSDGRLTSPLPATTLTGTAAIGAPISGSLFAIDINGKVSPISTTSTLGAFTVDVSGMTAPFILSITGTANGRPVTLNSIATAAGQTVNITPLTDLIVSTASGQPGGSPLATLCAPAANVVSSTCTDALKNAAAPAKLNAAVAAVIAMISPLNPTGANPLTGTFLANGTGMDAILDQILVEPADAQGAMATITLIATNSLLGTITLPHSAGGNSTIPAATPPSPSELLKATAAANVLPEIRACLASLSALYPTTGFVAPSIPAVTRYVDSTFNMGTTSGQDAFVSAMTSTDDMAFAGLTIEAAGLSPHDMSPLSAAEISTLTSSTSTSTTRVTDFINNRATAGATAVTFTSGQPSSAWIKLRVVGDAGVENWKMVKTTDTTGCPGGWKIAGSNHMEMHMNARITRNINNIGTATFLRAWAFHADMKNVNVEASTKIDVRGPGITTYGDFLIPGTTGIKLQLIKPETGYTAMRIADNTGSPSAFYGNSEALQSCQDLANVSPVAATPCIDESKVAPGKIYVWTLKNSNGNAVSAFPFQVNAVPLSKAFAIANQDSLFATLTSVTPATLVADTLLDNMVTFNYTQTPAYGSRMDNCRLNLWNANTPVLNAEQNAVGKETSCTFTTAGLNSLASNVVVSNQPLFKFTGPLTNGYIGLTTTVLGNQASSGQPFTGKMGSQ